MPCFSNGQIVVKVHRKEIPCEEVTINNVSVSAKLRIILKGFVDIPPLISNYQAFLLEQPFIDWSSCNDGKQGTQTLFIDQAIKGNIFLDDVKQLFHDVFPRHKSAPVQQNKILRS